MNEREIGLGIPAETKDQYLLFIVTTHALIMFMFQ
jgi:hypothetical protein